MHARVQVTELVNAPVEQVFEFICDVDRHAQWITGLTYVSARGRLKVGMQYMSKNSAMGREMVSQVRVLRVEPKRIIELESVSRPMDTMIQFETIPVDGRTRLIETVLLRSDHPVFGLARPLLESLAATRLEADLRSLKFLVEATV